MTKKDEITALAAQAVYDLAMHSAVDWDAIYYRFYSGGRGHASSEVSSRKGRKLRPLQGTDEHFDLLEKLMAVLFDEAERATGARPFVVVVEVGSNQSHRLKFAYDDPRALEIGLPSLGRATSYFGQDEIEIPQTVKDYQRELAEKGVLETPILYDPRKSSPGG